MLCSGCKLQGGQRLAEAHGLTSATPAACLSDFIDPSLGPDRWTDASNDDSLGVSTERVAKKKSQLAWQQCGQKVGQ